MMLPSSSGAGCFALLLVLLAGVVDAVPKRGRIWDLLDTDCEEERNTTPVRKEWRSLTASEQSEYLDAIQCLQSQPARFQSSYPGAQTRYDDYLGLHISQTPQIHFTGTFFPWHRYYVYLFEQDLRETCNYTGGQPYWDWSLDAVTTDSWFASPVFDAELGFGGNGEYIEDVSNLTQTSDLVIPGRTGGGPVTTGRWANSQIAMGPGNNLNYTPHALRRDFSPSLALERLNSSVIQWLQDADSFALYARRSQSVSPGLDGVFTHGGGHFGVGGLVGELSNTYSSPGDPIFWLHHGHIDYLWNEWQRRNWTIRKDEITGPDVMFGYPWNYFGDPAYTNVTLNTTMDFGPFGREITIASLMDISGGLLGYEYS